MRMLRDGFSGAQDNMDFDVRMVEGLMPGESVFRVYLWENIGITYGFKQDIPADLKALDGGRRVTGGGIVFHSPGDVVFSLAGFLDDTRFLGSLKEKLGQVQVLVREALGGLGVESQHSAGDGVVDYAYCLAYPNPFELYSRGEKVLALTVRRYRDRFLIQGILHVRDGREYFSDLGDYYSVMGGGLGKGRDFSEELVGGLVRVFG